MESCTHAELIFETTVSQSETNPFIRPSTPERITASQGTLSKKKSSKSAKKTNETEHATKALEVPNPSTYPGPLVLPGDDLYHDPEYPPQTMQEWIDESDRNPVTRARRTVYVVPAPSTPSRLGFIGDWTQPNPGATQINFNERAPRPRAEDIAEYLQAFYHPLPVRLLGAKTQELAWMEWDSPRTRPTSSKKPSPPPRYIALSTGEHAIRIRTRRCPDEAYPRQLNLNDLLDAALALLPRDAYALLMLVEHDLYEDADDDFCCGRAYGASRVAVVSTARYDPGLDAGQNVETGHVWPLSHCKAYGDGVRRAAEGRAGGRKTKRKRTGTETQGGNGVAEGEDGGAMRAAIAAACRVARPDPGRLWLGRVCKTAAHEVGHCFAMDHCVFYACVMQGTAGMSEDARQPPYLCPVDEGKLRAATGAADGRERDAALLRVCEKYEGADGMWAGFAAWLRFRMEI